MLRRSTRTHCVPSVFDLTPSCCALSGETANNNFIIFRLIHPRAPTYYLLHSRGAPPGSNLRSSTLEGSTPRAPTYDLLHSRGAPLGSNLRSSTLEGSTPRAQTYDLLHSRGARYPLHYRSGRTGEHIYSNRDVTGGVREKGRKRL
jgi:hypothetical protein